MGVDLTTFAADVPLPPRDHKFFADNPLEPADLMPVCMSNQELTTAFQLLDFRVQQLEMAACSLTNNPPKAEGSK